MATAPRLNLRGRRAGSTTDLLLGAASLVADEATTYLDRKKDAAVLAVRNDLHRALRTELDKHPSSTEFDARAEALIAEAVQPLRAKGWNHEVERLESYGLTTADNLIGETRREERAAQRDELKDQSAIAFDNLQREYEEGILGILSDDPDRQADGQATLKKVREGYRTIRKNVDDVTWEALEPEIGRSEDDFVANTVLSVAARNGTTTELLVRWQGGEAPMSLIGAKLSADQMREKFTAALADQYDLQNAANQVEGAVAQRMENEIWDRVHEKKAAGMSSTQVMRDVEREFPGNLRVQTVVRNAFFKDAQSQSEYAEILNPGIASNYERKITFAATPEAVMAEINALNDNPNLTTPTKYRLQREATRQLVKLTGRDTGAFGQDWQTLYVEPGDPYTRLSEDSMLGTGTSQFARDMGVSGALVARDADGNIQNGTDLFASMNMAQNLTAEAMAVQMAVTPVHQTAIAERNRTRSGRMHEIKVAREFTDHLLLVRGVQYRNNPRGQMDVAARAQRFWDFVNKEGIDADTTEKSLYENALYMPGSALAVVGPEFVDGKLDIAALEDALRNSNMPEWERNVAVLEAYSVKGMLATSRGALARKDLQTPLQAMTGNQ